jgi:signal transduction histidine kinase
MFDLVHRFRALPGRYRALADVAPVLLLLMLTLQPLMQARLLPPWVWLLVAVECLPLLLRRRYPFTVLLVVGAATAVHGVVAVPEPVLPWAALVALHGVAAHATRTRALAAAGIAAAVVPAILLLDGRPTSVEAFTVNGVIFATAWLSGDAVRHRRERTALLQEQAAAAERARMAREMHDVVAHHVSLMVVQAEAGPALLDRAPARAVDAFDAIGATGREALTELRRVLGTLRTADREPVPGLAAIPALVDGVRRAGLRVACTVTGMPAVLPADADRAAYRIVQESLTNVVKHAGGRAVTVELRWTGDALGLEIRDDGTAAAGRPGHGLTGMRERVSALGGRFAAGPATGGGWAVTATIPLGAAS